MDNVIIYDNENIPRTPAEITLKQITCADIVIIEGSLFLGSDTLDTVRENDLEKLLGTHTLKEFHGVPLCWVRERYDNLIREARENDEIVVVLDEGDITEYPYVIAGGDVSPMAFWKTVKILNEIRERSEKFRKLSEEE